MCHMSRVTCGWRVCYQRGLPRLVFTKLVHFCNKKPLIDTKRNIYGGLKQIIENVAEKNF